MSMCHLRSMSPLHLQYLKNMGVTATLVVSLVREGRLWGLIACHHYSPRNLRFAVRAAADLLAEVVSTRIAAIENYAHAQVAIQVRRLEQRLVEATSTEGDWRLALFRNPRTLLQPLEATGAALFHDGELLTAGEVPSTRRAARADAMDRRRSRSTALFSCSSVARANPALDSLTPTASGVLAVKLSASRPDYLMWFRKEQLLTVTWAGDPSKPVVGNDPLELSPRRSFAAWSEIVRGTALPWIEQRAGAGARLRRVAGRHHRADQRGAAADRRAPARADPRDGGQLERAGGDRRRARPHAVRQRRLRRAARSARRPRRRDRGGAADDRARQPVRPQARDACASCARSPTNASPGAASWRCGSTAATPLPVAVRAELVPARDGSVLGFFLILVDLTDSQRAAEARRHLEQSLSQASDDASPAPSARAAAASRGDLMGAILANASLAAMDIADGSSAPTVAPLLEELEASTKRATMLYSRIRDT